MALEPGSRAGPYLIKGQLGRGGMASVYVAHDPALERNVALKVLPREFLHDPDFAERFRREAKVIASLEHPNIIPIYAFDIEQEEGIPWMAMRLIAGGALSALLKERPLPVERAVHILRGVADALDYAHAKGIVHRDVKPQNILLDESQRVYLADFGIAKILESSGGLTATGAITGTPHYMAPEQATATKVDHRADVYALGIVAYEMFTGRVPFSADTPVAILMKHIQEPIPLPSPARVPDPLVRALLKATAKRPEDRWPSAGAFASALEAALRSASATAGAATVDLTPVSVPAVTESPIAPPPASSPTRVVPPPVPAAPSSARAAPPRKPGRGGLLSGLAMGFLLAVIAGVAAVAWRTRGQAPSPEMTEAAPGSLPASPEAAREEALPVPTARPPVETLVTPTPAPVTPAPGPAVVPPPVAARAAPTSEPVAPVRATPVAPSPEPVRPTAPPVPPVVEGLVQSLGANDGATRWRAAEALGNLGSEAESAVPALVGALRDRSADVRWRTAEALGKLGAGAAVPALAEALRDADDLVRGEAAKALGRLGAASEAAVPALAEGLGHSEVAFRREVARALVRIGPGARGAVPALTAALGDKDKFVRMESARALGNVGPDARPALPALTMAARDPELLVARQAQEALRKLGAE